MTPLARSDRLAKLIAALRRRKWLAASIDPRNDIRRTVRAALEKRRGDK